MIVQYIGSIAQQQIARAQYAKLVGHSSRGIFLRLDNTWVIFLSWEHIPGPLTLNLLDNEKKFQCLCLSNNVQVNPSRLEFLQTDGILDLSNAEIWRAKRNNYASTELGSLFERRARLAEIIHQALILRPGRGWSALLPFFGSTSPINSENSLDTPQTLLATLRDLQIALLKKDALIASELLGGLIGLGRGLTPSGDDLTLGLLLAISRWGKVLLPNFEYEELAFRVVAHAWQATTNLSASLIECAVAGQADPRLITALDGILTGKLKPLDCAKSLLAWGSSSGLDALLGMSLVI